MSQPKPRRSRARKPMAEREPRDEAESLREALMRVGLGPWMDMVNARLNLANVHIGAIVRVLQRRCGVTDEELYDAQKETEAHAVARALSPDTADSIMKSVAEEVRRVLATHAEPRAAAPGPRSTRRSSV